MKKLLVICIVLSVVCTVSPMQLPAELVGYWNFDGNVDDQSGMGNHGDLVDAVYDASFAPATGGGQSVSFEADTDHVFVENADGTLDSSTFTVSMFILDRGQVGALERLTSRESDTFETAINVHPPFDGMGEISYFSSAGGGWQWGEDLIPEPETWTHIAYTADFDTEELNIYVDGELGWTTPDPWFTEPTGFMHIGNRHNNVEGFDGLIDDVAMWDEVLSPADIKTISQSGVNGFLNPGAGGFGGHLKTDDALVGVWLFDEGAGEDVADSSGNDNHGIVVDGDFTWEPGKFGSSIISNVDGSIDVEDSDSLAEISEALTVAAWFRIDAESDTGVRKDGAFLLEDQSGVEPIPDGFSFRVWTDQGITPGFYGTTELIQGEWTHVAGTYDSDSGVVELYINGEKESENGGALSDQNAEWEPEWGGLVQAGSPLQLKFGPEPLTGGTDEVVIFSRALSQEEIRALLDGWENLGAAGGILQAGDADRDFDFDQLDLVQVQIGGKYLTGGTATWGEGDWDGAPGGSADAPPPGDGLFNQLDIIAALNGGVYLTGPYNALAGTGGLGDPQTSITYNPSTGELGVDAPAGVELTSVNIDSAGGIFTGEAAANLGGSFDNDADNNIFKATFGGSFGSTSFGNVAQTGLSQDFVLNDLTVVGSLAGGGDLGAVDLIYVPEPSAILLLVLGAVGIIGIARRRRI